MSIRTLRIGALISGTGRTLRNLLDERAAGRLPIVPACVLSSSADAAGLRHAEDGAIPASVVRRRDFASPEAYGDRLAEILRDAGVDLVIMAGFLHLWRIPADLEGRVMNIHPALIPSFAGHGFHGERVHRAVWESGVKVTGCTVHFADNDYDTGPVILQHVVPVHFTDTVADIAARVFEEECRAYPEAIRLFAEDRLRIVGRRVQILPLRESRGFEGEAGGRA